MIISLISGIALFLFGMSLMGDGLKKVAGAKLEVLLYRLSSTKFRGLLLGTGVTAVIQSSSATSIMVVGFVNSGMMKVKESISIIIGGILGTSITGWIISLSYIDGGSGIQKLLSTATITGVIATVGIILRMFCKAQSKKNIGDILMGFAVLMFGMSAMSSAVSPLSESEVFVNLLSTLSNPVLGILIGLLFTAVLQSASASVGVIQALSVTGAISFSGVLPLLMGVAIGAAVPVLLSSIGASSNGKRAAFSYPISNIVGVTITAAVFYLLNVIVHFPFTGNSVSPFSVALINTILRVAMVVVLMPMTGLIEKLTNILVKDKPLDENEIRLEERFLTYPALAIEQSKLAVSRMTALTKEGVEKSIGLIDSFSQSDLKRVEEIENDVDGYEDALGSYLMQLTSRELNESQNADVTKYIHTLTDFERITDHALSIAMSISELNSKGLSFSDPSRNDLNVLFNAVSEIVNLTVQSFEESDIDASNRIEPLSERIDELCTEMKKKHIERLKSGECKTVQGLLFNELLTDLNRIGAHCSNIGVAVIQLAGGAFETHDYLQSVKSEGGSKKFEEYHEEYSEKYRISKPD